MSPVLNVDIAIVGGGIAGLWVLARLRGEGYGALLIEGNRLGAGQTICSQGIIHGGTKYALTGRLSAASRRLGAMPEVWQSCLNGRGKVDLTSVRMLSPHQYLCTSRSLTSRLTGFFAGQAMRSRMETMDPDDFPNALGNDRFHGAVYRLDEPVLDVASLLLALRKHHGEAIVSNQGPVALGSDGTVRLRVPGHETLQVKAQRTVLTAGTNNEELSGAPMQRRPLHMVMVRGETLRGGLYAHFLGSGDVPRLTITSHKDRTGTTIWYLGGQLAEDGTQRDTNQQIAATRRELFELMPWVDFTHTQFATFFIDRAESRQHSGKRPDTPGIFQDGKWITAWPTKLAMAPLLADEILELLQHQGIRPSAEDFSASLTGWPRPEVAAYPWDEKNQKWY